MQKGEDRYKKTIEKSHHAIDMFNEQLTALREQRRQLIEKLNGYDRAPQAIQEAREKFAVQQSVDTAHAYLYRLVQEYGTNAQKLEAGKAPNEVLISIATKVDVPYEDRRSLYEAVKMIGEDYQKTHAKTETPSNSNFVLQNVDRTVAWANNGLQDVQRLDDAQSAYKALQALKTAGTQLSTEEIHRAVDEATKGVVSMKTEKISQLLTEYSQSLTGKDKDTFEAFAKAYDYTHVSRRSEINAVVANIERGDRNPSVSIETLSSIEQFNSMVKGPDALSTDQQRTLQNVVFEYIKSKMEANGAPLTGQEETLIKRNIHEALFSEIGRTTTAEYIATRAEEIAEYRRPAPNFDNVKITDSGVLEKVQQIYEPSGVSIDKSTMSPQDKQDVMIATIALVKNNGEFTRSEPNELMQQAVQETTVKQGLEILREMSEDDYKKCIQAIKELKVDAESGINGQSIQAMQAAVATIEQEEKALAAGQPDFRTVAPPINAETLDREAIDREAKNPTNVNTASDGFGI